MASVFKISPLDYIEAGKDLRGTGKMQKPHDPESLAEAFFQYARYIREKYYTISSINKKGDDTSKTISAPMQVESFRLFAGLTKSEYDNLVGDPTTAAVHALIEDAINAQQVEGAVIGVYSAKIVTILQGRKEKLEISGGMTLEQIVGMEVK